MKVEIHNLKHEKWFIEAEPTDTIGDLKEKNIEERKIDKSLIQKMIFSGKILKDSDTLEGVKYVEGKGFIVCMASKVKKTPKRPDGDSKTNISEAASSKAIDANSQSQTTIANPSEEVPKSGPLIPSNESGFMSGPSALASGEQLREVVENIKSMGYSQQQVLSAMRRAFNNPDRAVEYLVNGDIPADEDSGESARARPTSTADNSQGNEPYDNDSDSSGSNRITATSIDHDLFDAADQQMMEDEEGDIEDDIDFRELLGLDDQQMEELRASVRQNPDQVIQLLQPIIRDNPVVAETLVNNIDQFLWYLASSEEDANEADLPATSDPGSHLISITPEEEHAIRRLMELGFEWEIVATAYLACDKDEQLTANYLFEHGHED